MQNFTYYAPTQVVFGKNTESQAGELVKKYGGTKVLVHYGGGSVKRSGLLDRVCQSLEEAGVAYVTLGGVVPNPRLSLVHEGIDLCRKEGVDFLLAVGGGSVIDSCKAISKGVPYDGEVWDFYTRKASQTDSLPIGTVLTIPAAGSEMSDATVITKDEGMLKKDYAGSELRPKFSILNPELTFTLPAWQTACGATDMMMHTQERYFSKDDDMDLTDNLAEAGFRTVMNSVKIVLREPENYRHRAQLMWAGSVMHNDLTGCGTSSDWATHMLEHELSGMFDVSHGAGLAALWGSWARYVLNENPTRFARFAVNVLGVANDFNDTIGTAIRGIEKMEEFYRSIGMPTNIHELIGKEISDAEIEEMADKCSNYGTTTAGGLKVLTREDMVNIYKMAR